MLGIEKFIISDFKLGWIIGNFKPSLLKSKEIEVAVKFFQAGDVEPSHKQLIATEITIVVTGIIRLGADSYEPGDIIKIDPGVFAEFESITESALVCIKFPSLPNDKIFE